MNKIEKIIAYLEGKPGFDIYNGEHPGVVEYWNSIWDEVRFMGHDPSTVKGLKEYLKQIT